MTSFNGGAAERAIQQVLQELALRVLLASARGVDVCAIGLVTLDQTFVGHDLHEFQGGRVPDLRDRR